MKFNFDLYRQGVTRLAAWICRFLFIYFIYSICIIFQDKYHFGRLLKRWTKRWKMVYCVFLCLLINNSIYSPPCGRGPSSPWFWSDPWRSPPRWLARHCWPSRAGATAPAPPPPYHSWPSLLLQRPCTQQLIRYIGVGDQGWCSPSRLYSLTGGCAHRPPSHIGGGGGQGGFSPQLLNCLNAVKLDLGRLYCLERGFCLKRMQTSPIN